MHPAGRSRAPPLHPACTKAFVRVHGGAFYIGASRKGKRRKTGIVLPALLEGYLLHLTCGKALEHQGGLGAGRAGLRQEAAVRTGNDPLFDCPRHRVRRVGGDGVRVGKAAQAAGRLRETRIAPEDGRELFAGDGRIRRENTLRRAGDDAAERGPGDRLFIPAAGRRFTQKNAYPRRSLSIKQRRSPSARGRAF